MELFRFVVLLLLNLYPEVILAESNPAAVRVSSQQPKTGNETTTIDIQVHISNDLEQELQKQSFNASIVIVGVKGWMDVAFERHAPSIISNFLPVVVDFDDSETADKSTFLANHGKTADLDIFLTFNMSENDIFGQDGITVMQTLSVFFIDSPSIAYYFGLSIGLKPELANELTYTGATRCTYMAVKDWESRNCTRSLNCYSDPNFERGGQPTGTSTLNNAALLERNLQALKNPPSQTCGIPRGRPMLKRFLMRKGLRLPACKAMCEKNKRCDVWLFRRSKMARGRRCSLFKNLVKFQKKNRGVVSGLSAC